jgi:hypothetical protein
MRLSITRPSGVLTTFVGCVAKLRGTSGVPQ